MVGKTAAQALRALLLVGMVASLPLTSGWITVYVLGGIALLMVFSCCCCCNCCVGNLCDCTCEASACGPCCPLCEEPCCEDCDCDCSCCGEACCGFGGCDEGGGSGGGGGGDCCGGCDCGGCDCGCVETAPPEVAPVLAAAPLLVPLTRRLPAHWLSHHPDTPEYEQDTYPVAGRRLCIGCFTTYPLFLAASAWLALAPPGGVWWAWLAGGAGLASLQAVSSAGLARLRWQKAAVKTALGLGLAAAVHGVLVAPWDVVPKQAVPRGRRMRRSCDAVRTR